MHSGKYVFAQVMDFLPVNDFNSCVKKYNGSYKVHHFSCWHQLLSMVFGQIANRESLSDLVLCLRSQRSKWYHLGFGTGLSKSNLAYSNENRNWQIFADFAYLLIAQARKTCNQNDFDVDVAGNVYAIDSTTIDLCLSVFWWAPFRKTKAAVKVHTQFDIKTQVPTFILISDGLLHDVNILDSIEFEPGAFYIMDKAYIDFARLYTIHKANSFFVLRLQVNQDFRRVYSHKVDKSSGVTVDQTIKLNNFYPQRDTRKSFDESSIMTRKQISALSSSPTILNYRPLRSPHFISTDGQWNYFSNGSNNILKSKPSGDTLRMLYESRSTQRSSHM
jgi:hypothetical protein